MSNSGYAACNIKLDKLPYINPEKMSIEHKTFPDSFRSPSTGFYRSKRRWGMWVLMYDWANLEQDQAMPLIAQFNRYISADVPFTIYDVARTETSGNATQLELQNVQAQGVPNGQRGQSITLIGLPASRTCFKAGDLIGGSRNGEMYEVAEDLVTTSGQTSKDVLLTNFIRKPLAVGTNVHEPMYTAFVPVRVMGRMQAPDVSGGMPIYSFTVEMNETW